MSRAGSAGEVHGQLLHAAAVTLQPFLVQGACCDARCSHETAIATTPLLPPLEWHVRHAAPCCPRAPHFSSKGCCRMTTRPAVWRGAAGSQGHRQTDLGRLQVQGGQGGKGGDQQRRRRRRRRRPSRAPARLAELSCDRMQNLLQQSGQLERPGRAARRPASPAARAVSLAVALGRS